MNKSRVLYGVCSSIRKMCRDYSYISNSQINTKYLSPKTCEKNDREIVDFINDSLPMIKKEYQLGYECFGTLLYGFSLWLADELRKENINAVFFFSRDGLILKKAFDLCDKRKEFDTHYFFSSRRAFRVPILAGECSFENYIERIRLEPLISTKMFLDTFCLEDNLAYNAIMKRFDPNYIIRREKISNDPIFKELYILAFKAIRSQAEREKNLLKMYIEQEQVSGNIAVVDIGWHGNMQMNFETILHDIGCIANVYGYYVGVHPEKNHKDEIKMKGYLFDEGKGEDIFLKEQQINTIFELLFTAPHGSVKCFDQTENGIRPCLYPNENEGNKTIEVLWDYQIGGLEFIKAVLEMEDLFFLTPRFAVEGVFRQCMKPKYEDAKCWGSILFKDSEIKLLSYYSKEKRYYIHPLDILEDYRKSGWKQGFLKQLFLINMDYTIISRFITLIKNFFYRSNFKK